jgi:hypothetical protein
LEDYWKPTVDKVMPRFQATVDKLSSMFASPNNATSISRPPPYNDDRQYRLSRLISVASLTVLLLLSIPSLVLKAYSYSFVESNVEMGFYLVNDEVQGEPEGQNLVAALPLSLFRVPEKLALIVAMLNILLSMAHLAFIAWDWRAGRRVSRPRLIVNPQLTDIPDSNPRFPSQYYDSAYCQPHLGPDSSHCHVRFP